MSLPVPVVGVEPGPQFATDVNNSLNILDAHTHAPGSGVPITPDAMNINATVAFNNNFIVDCAGVGLAPQSVPPDLNTVYASGVDLYYVDGVGNNVRITADGGIAGTPGSISNLVPPASASYVAGTSTFVWQSNTSIAANMDFGSAILRNLSPNSTFGLTLAPPAGLSSNYTITLPSLPSVPSFLQLSNTGAMSAVLPLANGITSANIANGTITTTQISPTAGIVGTQLSSSADILLGQLNSAVLQWNKTEYTTVYFSFTLTTTHSATVGATYTNGGVTFTVFATIASATTVIMSSTGASPLTSGTLTKASGTGDASMAYSSVVETSGQSFTVPANVNQIFVLAAGGGGGGGGGANQTTGSGGGGGSMPTLYPVTVTPAQVIPVTIGGGGLAGITTAGVPTAGGAGGITRLSTTLTFPGGLGGAFGVGGVTPGVGGAWSNIFISKGGTGGAAGNNTGETGMNSLTASGGAGGTGALGFAGSGGGGAGFGAGAVGANGGNGGTGSSAANSSSAGGGGGSNRGAPTSGGAGGSGKLIIYWLGAP